VTAIDPVFAVADVGLWDLVLIAGMAFALSVVGGLSGYGIGLVLPAFIAPVVGVVAVIPVMSVAMTFANASRVWAYRRSLRLRTVAALMAAALPGAAAGAFLYVQLPPDFIAMALGIFFVATVPVRRLLEYWRFTVGQRGLMAIGAGYGFLAGGMTGAGLFMVAGLLAAGVQGAALVATDAAVSTAINILKVGVFGGSALLTPELILAGILIGLCTVPGAFVAKQIMDRLPLHVHVWMMEALVLAGGASFLWRAIADQFR
jgi:uncharacterized membrane protein YfcA